MALLTSAYRSTNHHPMSSLLIPTLIGPVARTLGNLPPAFVCSLAPIWFRGPPSGRLLYHALVQRQSTARLQIVLRKLHGCANFYRSYGAPQLALQWCTVITLVRRISLRTPCSTSEPNMWRSICISFGTGLLWERPEFCTFLPAPNMQIFSPRASLQQFSLIFEPV